MRSMGLGSCGSVILKMCCAADGEDRSTAAQLGGDWDPSCGCAVAVAAHRTKSQGSQDEGDLEREGRQVSGWEVLL